MAPTFGDVFHNTVVPDLFASCGQDGIGIRSRKGSARRGVKRDSVASVKLLVSRA